MLILFFFSRTLESHLYHIVFMYILHDTIRHTKKIIANMKERMKINSLKRLITFSNKIEGDDARSHFTQIKTNEFKFLLFFLFQHNKQFWFCARAASTRRRHVYGYLFRVSIVSCTNDSVDETTKCLLLICSNYIDR